MAVIVVIGVGFAGIAHGQILVDPAHMGDWTFGTTDSSGDPGDYSDIAEFVTGPANPLLGTGSAELSTAPGEGDGSAYLSTSQFNGLALADLTRLSYSTYDAVNNGSQFPYIQIFVNTGTTDPQSGQPLTDILFFEPPYQTASSGNPNLPDQGPTGTSVISPGTGVGSLSYYLSLYPNATIAANPYAGGGGIAFTVGYANSSDNFTGYVDNVTIATTTGGTAVYNFETPEPSTWVLMLGGLGLLLSGRRSARASLN
jgi:hypothetical protein